MTTNTNENMKPTISVIIPLYNKQNEIERAIRSVISQTYSNFELIIINDGSTDSSLNFAKKFELDSRIRILTQENRGLPATRNRGIMESKADLVSFLDADDEWLPDFLETILTLCQNYPKAGLYATSYENCIHGRVREHHTKGLSKEFEGYIASYFKLAIKLPFVSICVAIPKMVFESVGLFNPNTKMSEDNEMWTKIALYFPVAYTTKVSARYYLDSNTQMTTAYYTRTKHPIIEYINALPLDFTLSYPYMDDLNNYLEFVSLGVAYFNIAAGDMGNARNFLNRIHNPKFMLRKTTLFLVSYIPFQLGRYIAPIRIGYRNIKACSWKRIIVNQ